MTSKEISLAVCKALSDRKGKDIFVICVKDKTSLCDYFVLASGTSTTHIKSLGERVEETLEKEFGIVPTRSEGVRDGRWAAIDYGDVIVHIMDEETRAFYRLERLWADETNLEKYEEK